MSATMFAAALIFTGSMCLLLGFILGALFMVAYYMQKERKSEDSSSAAVPARSRAPGPYPK